MSCAVAMATSSPAAVFSPRPRLAPVFCIPLPSTSPSPSPLSPVPLSPFTTLRLQKQPSPFSSYVVSRYGSFSHDRNEPVVCSASSPSTAAATATMLKRKRPARIDISIAPIISFDGGKQDLGDSGSMNEVEDAGEEYAVFCKRGKKRGGLEDRQSATAGLFGDSKKAIFSVFDGHGGAKAADFAARNLNDNIVTELGRRNEGGLAESMEDGYLTTDADCLKADISGGACCVTALIHKGNVVVSNAGDCRAVMSRGGVAEALTADHRPSRQDERTRIEAAGGYVDCCHGVWRIQGSLAVSRGIGDRHLKEWVIAKPDTKVLKIGPDCEFLILASDGLWDKLSNQEAVDLVREFDGSDRSAACRKLVELSLERGSMDDVTVMVIQLGHFFIS